MPNPASPTNHRWLWPAVLVALTLFALGLRWYYVSTAMVYQPIRGDAIQYHAYAWNLAHHGVFARNEAGAAMLTPDSFRDPGYPLLLAAWMKLLGDGYAWYAAVLLSQALLGALTVTMATQLGRHWLPIPWAGGAGLLMAIWPHSITINSFVLSETLFGFLCVLAMLVFGRAAKLQSKWWAFAAGLTFGAAALTNAVLLPFGILLAAFLAWRRLVLRKVWMALALGAMLLPGAWAIRNTQIPPPVAGASSMDRALQNLVQGSWPIFHSAYIAMVQGDAGGQRIMQAINNEYLVMRESPVQGAKVMLQRFGEDPLLYLKWYAFEKPYLLWGWGIRVGQNDIYVFATKNSPFDTQAPMRILAAMCHGLNPVLALLALLSVFFSLTSRWRGAQKSGWQPDAALIAIMTLLVFVTFVYSVLQAEPRYSIPFRAFEMLLAITAVYGLAMWLLERRKLSMTKDA